MSEFGLLLTGAGLAIFGGYIGDEIRAWRERGRERDAIGTLLIDDLTNIEATVNTIYQIWESARIFPPNHVEDLLSYSSGYDGVKARMFLIRDKQLRQQIVGFFKKLSDTARKTEGKIGSLADTPDTRAEQAAFDTSFQGICTDAKVLREKLEKL